MAIHPSAGKSVAIEQLPDIADLRQRHFDLVSLAVIAHIQMPHDADL